MNTPQIQKIIFEETGLKTSARSLTGSMKNYIRIMPMFQKGNYPTFPFEFVTKMKEQYPGMEPNPNFFSIDSFCIYGLTTEGAEKYKTESKGKCIEQKNSPSWGSKNSQMRLDKAAARYGKKVRRGENCVRYN